MGGNALSVKSVRLPRTDYERVSTKSVDALRTLYPSRRVEVLGSYRSKADFGDCDVLVEGGSGYDPHEAAKALGAVEVSRNGPVTSVGVKFNERVDALENNLFQVDLVTVPAEAFSFAREYFGHGDTGNLLGRVAHAQGVALRHDGMFYYFRDGDYKFRELLLTRDFAEALRFMGYAVEPLAAGFDTPEDVYRYVASSPFFNVDVFLLENRNAKSRVRDSKRKMYTEFLTWCETATNVPKFAFPDSKKAWHPRLVEHFPEFEAEYLRAEADLAELRAVKAKFNGEWVSKLTGLQGTTLGGLLRKLKASFETDAELRRFVLQSSTDQLETWVREAQASLEC